MSMIKLVAFLGNPGQEYALTRHNIGWLVADKLPTIAQSHWQSRFKGSFCAGNSAGKRIYFLKPEVFMNLSGQSIIAAMQFFKIKAQDLLVVHDDIEMDFGTIGLKKGGGLGGHNGLRSIEKYLKTREFYRLRIGVSRPAHGNVASYVLSRFSSEEREWLSQILHEAAKLLEKSLAGEIDDAVQRFKKVQIF